VLKLIVAGAIGSDAEVRQLQSGQAAISFSIAHSEKWKNAQGQQQERTTWVKCTIWRKSDQIAVAQYLKKGTKVIAEGTPSARAWSNASGEPQSSLELNVREVEFMGSAATKPAGAQPAASNQQSHAPASNQSNQIFTGTDNDDLPF